MRPPLFVVGSDPVLSRLRKLALPAVLGAVLGLLGGAALHQSAPPTYTAQVSVELSGIRDQVDLNPIGIRGRLVTMDTDAQLARSDAVVLAVAVQQQRPVTTVRNSLLITARPLSRVMLLSYTARSPEAAEQGAALAARRFLEERQRLYVAPQREYLGSVYRSTESIDPQFDLVAASGSVPPRESLRSRAFSEDLGLSDAGRITGEHGLTSVADRGDIEVPLTSGAAVGALLGIGLFMVADRRGGSTVRAAPLGRGRRRRPNDRARPPSPRRVGAGVAVMILACSVASVAAAIVLVPTNYLGQARIHVPPERGNAFTAQTSATLQRLDFGTEAQLARSDDVLTAVAREPGVELSTEQLRARIGSTPANRGQVVEISFRAGSPEQAETMALLVADKVVAEREARAARWNEEQREAFDSAVASAEADLQSALAPGGPRDLINALNRRLTLLRSDGRALVGAGVDGGQVISSRVDRREGDIYETWAVVALGPVVGLGLGLLTRGGTRSPVRGVSPARRPPALPIRHGRTGRLA